MEINFNDLYLHIEENAKISYVFKKRTLDYLQFIYNILSDAQNSSIFINGDDNFKSAYLNKTLDEVSQYVISPHSKNRTNNIKNCTIAMAQEKCSNIMRQAVAEQDKDKRYNGNLISLIAQYSIWQDILNNLAKYKKNTSTKLEAIYNKEIEENVAAAFAALSGNNEFTSYNRLYNINSQKER